MILGCIGDDFTGSSDLGLTLASGGMRSVVYAGIPARPAGASVEAGIVALKTRTAPVGEAVRAALDALAWLKAQGAERFYFKICSTFDSTPEGNIGPVTQALIDAIGAREPVVVCPAFPAMGRTVYQGHLFVADRLLSESGMEAHPLTPMTDPDIRRWLARQCDRPIGHLPLGALERAEERISSEAAAGRQIVVADCVSDDDLRRLARASAGSRLLVGGSGLALGLPDILGAARASSPWRGAGGPCLLISGSCSQATRMQVARHIASGAPARRLAVADLVDAAIDAAALAQWALAESAAAGDRPVLVYTSADPADVARAQQRFGALASAGAIESFLARLAVEAVRRGLRRLIVAGGETSGAVVEGLAQAGIGEGALEIGPALAPGVPALRLVGAEIVLALKSGNFGGPDFFAEAAHRLGADHER